MPEGRDVGFSRNSTGVYIGKLKDIDDMTKFYPSLELEQPAYFFKKKGGVLIATGQRSEFGISFDMGKTWETEDISGIGTHREHFQGETNNKIIVINDIIIAIK